MFAVVAGGNSINMRKKKKKRNIMVVCQRLNPYYIFMVYQETGREILNLYT